MRHQSNHLSKLVFVHFAFLLALLSTNQVTAQQRTISGYITDNASGEPMYLARIFDTISRKGTVSNEYGFYSITLPSQSVVLRVSILGMETQFISVPLGQNELDVKLNGLSQELEEVKVSAESLRKSTEETNSGTLELSLDKVEKLPVFMGEKDVVKTLQLMPGVASGGEGSSGLYVRGGGPDQNLILLDDVPVYNAAHLFGFFSVFNNDALSKVTMIKGGFPARYGGRTSSVLDMRMKEGNLNKYNVEGSIGLISSKVLVEGPIKKDKTAFIVSARRTYADLLIKPFLANKENKGGYYFYDLNAKIHHKINNKHHLYLGGYFGQDRAKFSNESSYQSVNGDYSSTYESKNSLGWGNAIGALRWNYRIAPKLFLNTTATFSHYKFNIGAEDRSSSTDSSGTNTSSFRINYFSNIQDWSGKMDFTYVPNTKHYVKFGLGDTYHTFKPGVLSVKGENNGEEENYAPDLTNVQYAHEAFAFIEDDHRVLNWLKINYGVHFSTFFVKSKTYAALQPRVPGNAVLSDNSSLKFSYARTAQFIHLLSNTGIGLPTDLWVPSTKNIGPITANQVSLGYNQLFGKSYNLMVEGYYKTMDNLIQYKEGVSFIGTSSDWENKVEVGKGWSYGAEVFFEKKQGDLTGWVGYTLSWTERQFDNINGGEKFPYTYDRRHDVSVALTYQLDEKWDFGVVFVASTGRAVSLPTQQYNVAPNPVLGNSFGGYYQQINYLSSVNGYRMPAYHRLDVGVNRTRVKPWGETVLSFSIYNVYSRQNAFFIYVGTNYETGEKTLKQVALFPIIPSVSWKFKLTHLGEKK